MPLPASKLDEYNARLCDWTQGIQELELRRILSELNAIKKTATGDMRAFVYALIGSAYKRLQKGPEALQAFRAADTMAPTLTTKTNLGAALIDMGLYEEAVYVLAKAAEMDSSNVAALMNFSAALVRLGSLEEARGIFEYAVAAGAHSTNDLFVLASMAATVGAETEAIELFARFLAVSQGVLIGNTSAIEFIRHSPPELMTGLAHSSALLRTLVRAELFGDEVQRLRATHSSRETGETAGETEEDVLEWMRPFRERANDAVLGGGDNV